MSIKVQVVFYSMYGHVYRMAEAVVEGAKQVPGAEVSLYQVPELIPDDILEKYGAKAARASFAKVPVASIDKLPEAQAIVFGTPTRFGNMAAQGRPHRQGRKRFCFHRHATWWPGNDHHQFSQHLASSRHDHRRGSL
jgi:flavorubredoxin